MDDVCEAKPNEPLRHPTEEIRSMLKSIHFWGKREYCQPLANK